MRAFTFAALYAVAFSSALALAQTKPASVPAPAAPAAQRPTAPPLNRVDPNSPAQAGRNALYQYLDGIAAKDEAARRETIAKITTRDEAEARQQQVRTKLLELVGGNFQRTPLNARVLGSTQLDGFRIEKVLFDSQPNFPVTALLYLPDQPHSPGAPSMTASSSWVGSHKLPAIGMAPGHSPAGKAGDFALASTFARNGFAVLSYDPIGQGERLQYPDPAHPGQSLASRPTGEHGEAGLQPTLIGDAVARYFAWDGIRAVDYLISRPEVDPDRIGAFGCSGGGAMTALLGAADHRVHAIATACYITSMDTLLPAIGPQDAEQSIPGFIAAGFDLADWVELAAPRPYAIVGTTGDMFPWKGLLASAQEARRFYSLFNPAAEGTPPSPNGLSSRSAAEGPASIQHSSGTPSMMASSSWVGPTPTGPTLNPDTPNVIAPNAPFQVIAGIGGHGNLRPLTSQIVSFFLVNLAHSDAKPILPSPTGAQSLSPSSGDRVGTQPPPGTLQVTPTGQVLTSYPGSETVHSLNLKRAAATLPQIPVQTLLQVQTGIRMVTRADAAPGQPPAIELKLATTPGKAKIENALLATAPDIDLPATISSPSAPGRHPAVLELVDQLTDAPAPAKADAVVMRFTPRPSPPGGEETKSPILGPFYLTELRAELVGKTLLGMRVDDVIGAIDYLASRPDVDPDRITAVASGHMGLVLLHAAVLDPRLKHITIDHTLESYHSLLETPMPIDAPQDILPGVLKYYDIPDLERVLGSRLTFNYPITEGAPAPQLR